MNPEMAMVVKRNEEREALRSVIQQWNANRLDLFELSQPNEVFPLFVIVMYHTFWEDRFSVWQTVQPNSQWVVNEIALNGAYARVETSEIWRRRMIINVYLLVYFQYSMWQFSHPVIS